MRKALAARYLEHLTGDDLIDLDELIGADDDEDFISASLQNAIQEISSGGSTAGKQMRALKAHAQDSAQPYGHHSMTKRRMARFLCGLERAGRYLKQPSFLSWLRRRGRDGMDQEHLFEGPPYSCHPLDHAVWKAQDLGISFEDQKV
ncbi:unnamed protein product [Durusdinium trenchii]|uniref:Uncharacterized protein n=1 Tax=Durusdinium trenchii TaxID=1381693 RepID=A0ABP0PD63_9DINO